jgi:hypothetical protein
MENLTPSQAENKPGNFQFYDKNWVAVEADSPDAVERVEMLPPTSSEGGSITHLDKDMNPVEPGSPEAVFVRTEGLDESLRFGDMVPINGTFRIGRTWRHPNPPPAHLRRFRKPINEPKPAQDPRPTSSGDDEAVATQDCARIEPSLDPPAAPSFDREAIWDHIQTLFMLAQGVHGKFVVLVLTGDKGDPPYKILHFMADGGAPEAHRMLNAIWAYNPAMGLHPDGVVRKPWKKPGKLRSPPNDGHDARIPPYPSGERRD